MEQDTIEYTDEIEDAGYKEFPSAEQDKSPPDEDDENYINQPMVKKGSMQLHSKKIRSPSKWGIYFEKNDKIFKVKTDPYTKARVKELVCEWMCLTEILYNLDTGQVKLKIEYLFAGMHKELLVPKGMLTKVKIMELLDKGLDVTEDNVRDVLRLLNLQEKVAELRFVHEEIGIAIHKDQLVFKHSRAYGIESDYIGNLKLEPQGSLESNLELIESLVLGHTPLELAYVIGLSAPVVSMLRNITGLNVLLFHIYGNSTEGKSTATMVAVSPFGLPKISDDGLIKTFSATDNAKIGYLMGNKGIPLGIDEASIESHKNFSSLIYTMTGGTSKARMNQDGTMKQTHEYSTTVITNAEHSLTGKSDQNIGILMRITEMFNVQWTKDAEHADTLKEELPRNYGHIGPMFAESLIQLGQEAIRDLWKDWCSRCFDAIPQKDQFSQRIANKFALIMTTAQLACEITELDFNLDTILELLLRFDGSAAESRDIGDKAYQSLIEFYNEFGNCFVKHFDNGVIPHVGIRLYGVYLSKQGSHSELLIQPTTLKSILLERGFQDINVILNNWRAKGILDCDKDGKFTRKRRFMGAASTRVHVIRVKNDDNGSKRISRVSKPAKSATSEIFITDGAES